MANAHSPVSDMIHYAAVLAIAGVVGLVLIFTPDIISTIAATALAAFVAHRVIDGPLAIWLGKRGIWS